MTRLGVPTRSASCSHREKTASRSPQRIDTGQVDGTATGGESNSERKALFHTRAGIFKLSLTTVSKNSRGTDR